MERPKTARALKVALVGRPNVGKSTLFNRLAGTKAALVDPTPGLTRDVRQAEVVIQGRRFLLFDTGGLAAPGDTDPLAGLVHRQSLKAIEQADRVLFLVDARNGLTAADREVAELLREKRLPFFLVANKADTPSMELGLYEFYELGVEEIIPVSAEHGLGMDGLLRLLLSWADEAAKSGHGEQEPPGVLPEEEMEGPIRVALLGRPNVGKSSLLNRLAGEPRMIVTDIPGTTRDAVDTLIERPQGRDIVLTDTAGIRRRSRVRNRVEKFSVLKAIEAIRTSHLVLVLLDAPEGVTDQDKRLIGYVDEYSRGCITLFNKWDLVQGDQGLARLRMEELERAKRFIPYAPHINISALTGKGVKRIFPLVDQVFRHFSFQANTGRVNRVLQRAMAQRTPPVHKGHHIRLYYATQTGTAPPTFLVFANYPDCIPAQYKRFLANQFRRQLEVEHAPVRLVFRQRERRR